MVGAVVLSPADAVSQEAVVGSAQRVVVARSRAPRDAAAQHYLEYLSSEHPDFELEGSARSVVHFEGVLPKATPYVASAPIELDEQVGIVVDVPPGVYELVRLVVHLARCLYYYVSILYRTWSAGGQEICQRTNGRTKKHNGYVPLYRYNSGRPAVYLLL